MLSQKIITIAPSSVGEVDYKLDFQQGNVVFSVIPVTDAEDAQVSKKFKARAAWSNNNKFFVYEPITVLDGSDVLTSSGEALVTSIQAVFCKVQVTNVELVPQKFYVSAHIPGTSSHGVI